MKFFRHIVLLLTALVLLAACDIEKLVDTPVGNWEVTSAQMVIKLSDGTTIRGTTNKELKDGLRTALEPKLNKFAFMALESILDIGIFADEEKPIVPEGSARMEFREDETLLVWTLEDGEWKISSSGEWSYAEGSMTLYLDSVIYNCTVDKLTNKRLFMSVAFPDWSTLIAGMGADERVTRAWDDELGGDDMGALGELLSILMGMQMSVDLQLKHL